MTLPLIFALSNSTWLEKRKIINIVKNHNDDPKKVAEVIEFVIQKGGIQYAEKVMHQYKGKALDQLASVPDSPSKQSLIQLVNYSIERKK
jgi:octaprenyl-diphosphate synthase